MAYQLNHTAESIDRKLGLIAENKNLLPYPYSTTFPEGLTDVGDGSILTSDRSGAYSEESFTLNDFSLLPGEYTISLDVTTVLEEPTITSGFELEVVINNGEPIFVADTELIELTEESTLIVSLVVPDSFETGLIIKPQIEAGDEKTAWVPNMDQIGTYVDRRFNGLNTKVKVINDLVPKYPNNPDFFLAGDGTWQSITNLTIATKWPKTFEDSTWLEIAIVCENNIPTDWCIGDTKTMTIEDVDYTIVIIGVNHDVYADSGKYAPYTFQFLDCYNCEVSGVEACLPSAWPNSYADDKVANILYKFPGEIQNKIKNVTKTTLSSSLKTSPVKLFLLSTSELGTPSKSYVESSNSFKLFRDGDTYSYYLAGNSTIKTFNGEPKKWLLRTRPKAQITNHLHMSFVTETGAIDDGKYIDMDYTNPTSSVTAYLAPAFCF